MKQKYQTLASIHHAFPSWLAFETWAFGKGCKEVLYAIVRIATNRDEAQRIWEEPTPWEKVEVERNCWHYCDDGAAIMMWADDVIERPRPLTAAERQEEEDEAFHLAAEANAMSMEWE